MMFGVLLFIELLREFSFLAQVIEFRAYPHALQVKGKKRIVRGFSLISYQTFLTLSYPNLLE